MGGDDTLEGRRGNDYLEGGLGNDTYIFESGDGKDVIFDADGAGSLHVPIPSVADVYQGEAPGSQWINFKDYSLIASKYLEEILWP